MADTLTSKGFKILDPNLAYDVNKFNDNFTLANTLIGTIVCTSTTRPSTNLFDGMTLWETDTLRFVVRVSAAWVPVPSRAVVANQAARDAIVTKWDGLVVYRQDKDWQEIYDGTAWRVQGTVTVAALADITNPITGQLAVLSTDSYLYRYTGSAWQAVVCVNNTNVLQYSRSTNQSIPNNTAQKINFLVADKTSADFSHAVVGTGSEFTCLRAGRIKINTNGSIDGSGSGSFRGWWIATVNDSVRYGMQANPPSTFFVAFSVAREIPMAVNDKFSIFGYQDSGVALNNIVAQAPVNVTARWMGPS